MHLADNVLLENVDKVLHPLTKQTYAAHVPILNPDKLTQFLVMEEHFDFVQNLRDSPDIQEGREDLAVAMHYIIVQYNVKWPVCVVTDADHFIL
jgi:hypothetical protein